MTLPDVTKGWTLAEALRRMVDPDLVAARERALRRIVDRDLGTVGAWAEDLDPRRREDHRGAGDDAIDQAEQAFVAVLRKGGLSLWGRLAQGRAAGGDAAKHSAIEEITEFARVQIGARGAILDSALEIRRSRGGQRRRYREVRAFPWLHLPDAPARMAGLALSEAFRRFVREDPEVVLAARLGGAECCAVLDGFFTDRERLWPLMFEEFDLATEWVDAVERRLAAHPRAERGGRLGDMVSAPVKRAATLVRDRVERLIGALRTGELVAAGHHRGSGTSARIAPVIWLRPSTRVDFINGEIHRVIGARVVDVMVGGRSKTIWVEDTESEWTGLALERPPAEPVPAQPAEPPREKHAGGRPATVPWEAALDRLAVRLGHEGHPEGGSALADMMLDCFDQEGGRVPDKRTVTRWLAKNMPKLWDVVTGAGQN